ncbi:MAG: Ribosomal RNA small subunit methyltransferase H [candidate division WS6 bacterium GW2011_GWF2_39_15]|uniref:Ribosomal RNA small subunit methyltransferase H n=1 Tax=candidate division WS6 bacterium GW2011_GWF2_39_15 TaxID=1619100 RepID=A0A0G0Q6X8_9BACT|nr:MAG: Ribosomal RNA small subunit methyltransferase H [candidate division WS6 bacterium GW2011_GWF2_39_15]
MKSYHTPVLLTESIVALNIKPRGVYVDCTLGEAGHSFEIFKRLESQGKLISIDQDQSALSYVKEKYSKEIAQGNWIIVKGNFSNLKQICMDMQIEKVDGILMDLGLSSRQLEEEGRGFSYNTPSESLDMRMDTDLGVTADDLLKGLNATELEKLFRLYGEERFAKRIAIQIKKSDIKTVGDLTSLIYRVVPATKRREDSHHPARRVFQALRIAVNDEINALKKGLDEAYELLNSNGRLCVITFHSLEDREVKRFFENKGAKDSQAVQPTPEEIEVNNRSRSAKLRVLEK